jgi:hypothetical protein
MKPHRPKHKKEMFSMLSTLHFSIMSRINTFPCRSIVQRGEPITLDASEPQENQQFIGWGTFKVELNNF